VATVVRGGGVIVQPATVSASKAVTAVPRDKVDHAQPRRALYWVGARRERVRVSMMNHEKGLNLS